MRNKRQIKLLQDTRADVKQDLMIQVKLFLKNMHRK